MEQKYGKLRHIFRHQPLISTDFEDSFSSYMNILMTNGNRFSLGNLKELINVNVNKKISLAS